MVDASAFVFIKWSCDGSYPRSALNNAAQTKKATRGPPYVFCLAAIITLLDHRNNV
ncbi:MAG: hypothetical protein AAAB16_12355 [Pseudomonas sp.]|uniref:hypothetical protein n=1 Tax=Pseudomonas sp. TaxID=306 RepID=UPI0030F1F5A5